MKATYNPPLSLTIIGTVLIGLATLVAAWITFDIIVRRGWKTMMAIMIPVYILNALYLAPITLWTYLKYGRPEKLDGKMKWMDVGRTPANTRIEQPPNTPAKQHDMPRMDRMDRMDHEAINHSGMHHGTMHNMHMPSPDQPMFPTVTIAVCHCGAGCLLGDIVGEWLVFGTNATLDDYAFALLFGIVFQYFSIAPMSGDYGPKTLWRAAKADFLSLTFFEIGLFGWMAIFQFGIFGQGLGMDNVVGMFFGHWTAFPINWWLITSKVKERVV
ncbi:hypothetical protein BGZ57DRAFT_944681 [Hyaloscypha finlandica]|nr:hypothetical protein BGZ57DRAFT_944681 [Hyaloscypha finlandica]